MMMISVIKSNSRQKSRKTSSSGLGTEPTQNACFCMQYELVKYFLRLSIAMD
jgi:hypothetical protein